MSKIEENLINLFLLKFVLVFTTCCVWQRGKTALQLAEEEQHHDVNEVLKSWNDKSVCTVVMFVFVCLLVCLCLMLLAANDLLICCCCCYYCVCVLLNYINYICCLFRSRPHRHCLSTVSKNKNNYYDSLLSSRVYNLLTLNISQACRLLYEWESST